MFRLHLEKIHCADFGGIKHTDLRKYTHVDTLVSLQLRMQYNATEKCALSHFALNHCNTSRAYSVWNMKMNLLRR